MVVKHHEGLAHPSDQVLIQMLNNGNIFNCKLTAKDVNCKKAWEVLGICEGCIMGKMTNQLQPMSKLEISKEQLT